MRSRPYRISLPSSVSGIRPVSGACQRLSVLGADPAEIGWSPGAGWSCVVQAAKYITVTSMLVIASHTGHRMILYCMVRRLSGKDIGATVFLGAAYGPDTRGDRLNAGNQICHPFLFHFGGV